MCRGTLGNCHIVRTLLFCLALSMSAAWRNEAWELECRGEHLYPLIINLFYSWWGGRGAELQDCGYLNGICGSQ